MSKSVKRVVNSALFAACEYGATYVWLRTIVHLHMIFISPQPCFK